MGSMVAFPFKSEDPEVATAGFAAAASSTRVDHVLAVGAAKESTFEALERAASVTGAATGKQLEVVLQERIGERRAGKGDGINTAFRRFLRTDLRRLHLYDADIANFDESWIEGAEQAADDGYSIVRHYFPRSSTDAMITWMITRPLFALGHPGSSLWRIRQPLGGELLVDRAVVEAFVDDPLVTRRSDWGIDTMITYAGVRTGLDHYEHYVAGGKQHRLYGSLDELRQMVVECFEAAVCVSRLPAPPPVRHDLAPPAPAGADIAHSVGYDVESTLWLLTEGWSAQEVTAAGELPAFLSVPLLENRRRPHFSFLDAGTWGGALMALRERYRSEPGWRGVLFRLWVARVLAYTTTDALAGHDRAMEVLQDTIAGYAGGV